MFYRYSILALGALLLPIWPAGACPFAEIYGGAPQSRAIVTPKIVVISGPSGGGKTTLAKAAAGKFPGLLTLHPSYTTRPIREGEVDGVDYHFVSLEKFEQMVAQGKFGEHATVHGNQYGSLSPNVSLSARLSPFLVIDVNGAATLRTQRPGQVLSIYVRPPSLEILEQRLRARGTNSEEDIRRRLRNARDENLRESEFDVVIINDDLDLATAQFESALRQYSLIP